MHGFKTRDRSAAGLSVRVGVEREWLRPRGIGLLAGICVRKEDLPGSLVQCLRIKAQGNGNVHGLRLAEP